MDDDRNALLTERQAADLLNLSPRTLAAWRLRGRGPSFLRIGKTCVRYRLRDLDKWVESRVCDAKQDSALEAGRHRVNL